MQDRTAEWVKVAKLLRAQRQIAKLSLRSLAALTNVSDSYLSQVERGLYQPSPEVLKAWATALGIPATALFEQLGWLDRPEPLEGSRPIGGPEVTVEVAIDRDERLTAAQKRALLSMYRTLTGEE